MFSLTIVGHTYLLLKNYDLTNVKNYDPTNVTQLQVSPTQRRARTQG
jgi:hypothetical protein